MPANAAAITASFTYNGGSDDGGGGNSTLSVSVTPAPTYSADSAALGAESQQGNIITWGGTAVITVPFIPGIDEYTLGIPVAYLSTPDGEGTLAFNTDTGSATLPADMLAGISGAEGKKVEITIGQGDKSGLPEAAKEAIGDRPLIQLAVKIDGKRNDWSNPNAPATIAIPYTPTASELANPEGIVIWYIDGSGKETGYIRRCRQQYVCTG